MSRPLILSYKKGRKDKFSHNSLFLVNKELFENEASHSIIYREIVCSH